MNSYFIPTTRNVSWEIFSFDLNNDGTKDFILFDQSKNELIPFTSVGKSTWTEDEKLFLDGNITVAEKPQILFDDFNKDGYKDLLVYGLGPLINGRFQGTRPHLLLGSSNNKYTESPLLDEVYQLMMDQSISGAYGWGQTDLAVSTKYISSADINNDGLMDLWIESSGGWNASGHFLLNYGNKFHPTQRPIQPFDYWGPNYAGWRYNITKFIDLNKDGAADLVMGQMRAHSFQTDATSKIFMNDGAGLFPTKKIVNLPTPDFNGGWTKVTDLDSGDIDGDGLTDLVLIHTRYGSTTPEYSATSWIGTYVQILTQKKDGGFEDKSWKLGDQISWSASTNSRDRYAEIVQVVDVNKDGKLDIVLGYPWNTPPNNTDCPLILLQSEYATFASVDYRSIATEGKLQSAVTVKLNSDVDIAFAYIESKNDSNGIAITSVEPSALVPLYKVSRVKHGGASYALDTDAVAGQAYRIYKAAFDRIPDSGGLGYWIAQMDKGMGVVEVAARFIDSPEFRSLYGQNPSNADFLTKVYTNVLGRTPDQGGYDWWLNELNTNPDKTRQKVLADFAEIQENKESVAALVANGIQYAEFLES
jgi:hypothetical protein